MSPDNTPKKRQRHSSHEKDEYSSSKKRKYHDDSGVDQVKVGIDGQDQYKATTVTIKPSDIRKAEMRGFVLRGFDQNIFDSVASVSARNMLHQTKTHSPIFVVAFKENLQQMVVLEGTHRVLSLISRLEEPDQEDFDFEAVIYETSDDFAGIWDSCVELGVGQSAKADVCRFPRKMMHLVQTTYGREFAKSLLDSRRSNNRMHWLSSSTNIWIPKPRRTSKRIFTKRTRTRSLLYRKCFDEGLVAA
ncbi:Protein CBG26672 [Caenorhabditis briggsae]|nr:Protein CBG26672 [Caenorhabditis briggsae]CAS01101.1 Protein CBG26672 [Caenorhabditis briggsae]